MRSPLATYRTLLADSQRGIGDVMLMLVPQFVIVVTGFLTTVLIARGLGPLALGQYTLVISMAGVAAAFSDLGIGQTAIRYASRAVAGGRVPEQHAVLRWALGVRLLLVTGVTITVAVLAPLVAGRWWKLPALTPLIEIGLLGGFCAALASVPTVYFQSVRRFDRNAIVQIGQALLSFAGVLVIAFGRRWSVTSVIVVGVVSAALGAIVFLPMIPRASWWRGAADLPPGAPRARPWSAPVASVPLGEVADAGPGTFARFNVISSVIVMVTLRLDVWLMGVFLGPQSVGLYTVASRFALPLALLLGAVTGALWPRASARSDPREALVLLERTFRLSLPLGLLALGYAIVAPMLTPWAFGSAYRGSEVLAQVLCVRYALAILIVPIGVVGYSLGFVRVYWIINAIQLAVVALVNVLLLRRIGPMASALALVASEAIGLALAGGLLWRRARQIARTAPALADGVANP